MFLKDSELALNIQTKLNTIAEDLYDDEDITHKIVFHVASDFEEYYRITEMDFGLTDSIRYTPIMVEKVSSTMQDDFVSGFYQESYLLHILGFERDKADLELILDTYSHNENLTDKEVMSGYVVKKNTGRKQFVATHPDTHGRNEPRAEYMLSFSWDIVLGGIISDDVTVSIGGSAVNHIQLQLTSDKISIGNVAYGTNTTPVSASGVTMSVTLPIQVGNTVHQGLFTDMLNKSYNKSYAVSVAFSTFYTMSYTMTLKRGNLNYVRDQLISFTLEFEEALPRTTVLIDSVAIPVLNFQMISTNGTEDKTITVDNKKVTINNTKTWVIRFAYDSSVSKNRSLLTAILDSAYLETEYSLGITVTGITARTYTVVMTNGVYNFEQTGELSYECTFQLSGVL